MGEEDFLTFDELRKAQSKERNKDTLQELDNGFFNRARNYLDMKKNKGNYVENKEYRNAKHILEDIIDRRQKKIVKLAVLSVKSNVKIENLLPSERSMFDEVHDIIADTRSDLQQQLFDEDLNPQQIADPVPAQESDNTTEDESGELNDTDFLETDDTEDEPAIEDSDDADELIAEDEEDLDETDTDDMGLEEPDSAAHSSDETDDAEDLLSANEEQEDVEEPQDNKILFGGADEADEDSVEPTGSDEPDEVPAKIEDDADESTGADEDSGTTILDGSEGGADDEDTSSTDLLADDTDTESASTNLLADNAEDDPNVDEASPDDSEQGDGRQRIKLLESVPEFMGVDLEAYGPFDEGDEVAVPEKNAEVLIDQDKAEQA